MSDQTAAQVIAEELSGLVEAEGIATTALAALAAAGYALVELPPADATYRITGGEIAENGEWYAYVRVPQGLLDGVPLGDFHELGPTLAGALLAAAQSAETGR